MTSPCCSAAAGGGRRAPGAACGGRGPGKTAQQPRTNLPCTRRGRWARSTFQLLEALPDAGAALTQWNLSTGRTHQIRVHAQHIGHPLLGDDAYGGAGGAALFVLAGNNVERCVYKRSLQ